MTIKHNRFPTTSHHFPKTLGRGKCDRRGTASRGGYVVPLGAGSGRTPFLTATDPPKHPTTSQRRETVR